MFFLAGLCVYGFELEQDNTYSSRETDILRTNNQRKTLRLESDNIQHFKDPLF